SSRPPSRCRSVLLPEPEAPRIATLSPRSTLKVTPFRTSTSSAPSLKRLTRSRVRSTTSLIAQRCGRPGAARGDRREQRREEAQQDGDADRRRDVGQLEAGRDLADVVHVG